MFIYTYTIMTNDTYTYMHMFISHMDVSYIHRITCGAVCCSVLQCVAVCCSADISYIRWQTRVAVCRSVSQCVAVCCSVLQCVAVCWSVLQCVAWIYHIYIYSFYEYTWYIRIYVCIHVICIHVYMMYIPYWYTYLSMYIWHTLICTQNMYTHAHARWHTHIQCIYTWCICSV